MFRDEVMSNSEELKSVALSIVEFSLAEGSHLVENSVFF